MADKWDHSVRPTQIRRYATKCRWCRAFCGEAGCQLKTVKFVKLTRTKRRNDCDRCPIPIECGMSILWHPSVGNHAIHYPECARLEGLEWEYPDPELADPDLAYKC